jgi:hypothetical protein
MCASVNTTSPLLECPVCCSSFLAQAQAGGRVACPHCGAHYAIAAPAEPGSTAHSEGLKADGGAATERTPAEPCKNRSSRH